MAVIAFYAPDTPRPDTDRLHEELSEPGAVEPGARAIALAIVAIAWGWAIFNLTPRSPTLPSFMDRGSSSRR
jgi:hypothetical protein